MARNDNSPPRDVRQRIARAFARGAATYDRYADLQRQVANKLLAELSPLSAHATVLDIGCGTGYCTQLIQQRSSPATAIVALDLVLPMLHRTRQHTKLHECVQLLCGDAQSLPLRGASVDVIVSSLTVQWCSEVGTLFSELHRVLRPGGRLLLSTLGPATLQELRAAWAQVDATHAGNSFKSQADLMNAATAAGLRGAATTELQVRHYQSLSALAQELKGLGANAVTSLAPTTVVSPAAFKAASAAFAHTREAVGIPVSWEIFYLQLQKPE